MKLIIELSIQIAAIIACLFWYDWKLLVIFFLMIFGNNMMIKTNRIQNPKGE